MKRINRLLEPEIFFRIAFGVTMVFMYIALRIAA